MYTQNGTTWNVIENANLTAQLPVGIYSVEYNPYRHSFNLERKADCFKDNIESLLLDEEFINNTQTMFNTQDRNLGIALVGLKGTGKTVTAKELCNRLQLPVICLGSTYGAGEDNGLALTSFIQSIEQECIIFVDEYEKIFPPEDTTMLKLLDSNYCGNKKRLYLLTMNSMDINENLIARPSRIRYIRKFGNLTQKEITMLIDKYLPSLSQDQKQQLLAFILPLSLITIDLLKSICFEIKTFGFNLKWIDRVFNLKKTEYVWGINIYEVELQGPAYDDISYGEILQSTISTEDWAKVLNNYEISENFDILPALFKECKNKDRLVSIVLKYLASYTDELVIEDYNGLLNFCESVEEEWS